MSSHLVRPEAIETAQSFLVGSYGSFPNNDRLPLVIYHRVLSEPSASDFEKLFGTNRWGGGWRNGVYGFHHYHSQAHEVLGVYSGGASLQLGGEEGELFEVTKGDVIVIPAGVSHKRVSSDAGFAVVGAYPPGQHPDMCYGKPGERPAADESILKVPGPEADPVSGSETPLLELWNA